MRLEDYEFEDDLIYALCDADGAFNVVLIHDKRQKAALTERGLIRTNIRGSSYGTDKLQRLVDEYEASL